MKDGMLEQADIQKSFEEYDEAFAEFMCEHFPEKFGLDATFQQRNEARVLVSRRNRDQKLKADQKIEEAWRLLVRAGYTVVKGT